MPAAVQFASPGSVPVPPRKRWTRTDYAALDAAGVLPGERLELIEKRAHVNSLTLLQNWLVNVFGANSLIRKLPSMSRQKTTPPMSPSPTSSFWLVR